jgi:hypothetical protein
MRSRSSGREVEAKKQALILSKLILYIALCFAPLLVFSQNKKITTWEAEKDYLKYQKQEGYSGPDDWYGSSPAEMDREDEYDNYNSGGSGSNQGYRGVQYSPQQIQRDRQERYQGFDRNGGGGSIQDDPDVQRPPPLELPDIDPPDLPSPDFDLDTPNVSGSGIWKILLFILIAALVLLLAYLIFKNSKPPNKKVIVDVEDDWNPEVISKTELELRLETAMASGDYRECVRIYFTFILKELIRKSWISWKKDKTNHSYFLEMGGRQNSHLFGECIRIYDLVWYGEYEIDREVFEMLRPTLENYYQSLEPSNE